MAQDLFQMPGMWHDIKYEELQRLRQTTLLQCVSFINEIFFIMYYTVRCIIF